MKKFFKFLFFLLPWFISSLLFKTDTLFYKSIKKPPFAPAPILFPIVWTILYILIAINIYNTYKLNNYKNIPDYNKSLLINYFSNQIFTFLFFTVKSPFLAMVDTIVVLLSSLFLYYESKEYSKKYSKFLLPYIFWNIFACILIISIFFLNL